MTYTYNHQLAAAPAAQVAAGQIPRQYQQVQTPQFPQQSYYFQAAPQQQFQAAFVVPQNPTQSYQVMQFASQPGPQQAVYMPDEKFAQPAFIQMGLQPIQNQVRYANVPTAQQPAVQAPQIVQPVDPHRKVKKEQPVAAVKRNIQPQQQQIYVSQPVSVAQPAQTVAQPAPAQEIDAWNQNLDASLPRAPGSIMLTEFTQPPGCFNIIKRGNLPGLSFISF